MRIITRLLLALAAGFFLATGTSYAAPSATTWANDLLNVQVLGPNPQTVQFNGNFTVPTTRAEIFPTAPFMKFSISPNGLSLANLSNSSLTFGSSTIVKVTDLTAPRIQNAQIDPNSFASAPLISGDNFVQFDAYNFPNGMIGAGQAFVVDVSFLSGLGVTPVPEPASLALLGSAILGLGLTRLRRSRTST